MCWWCWGSLLLRSLAACLPCLAFFGCCFSLSCLWSLSCSLFIRFFQTWLCCLFSWPPFLANLGIGTLLKPDRKSEANVLGDLEMRKSHSLQFLNFLLLLGRSDSWNTLPVDAIDFFCESFVCLALVLGLTPACIALYDD